MSTINGTDQNDTLHGTQAADLIHGHGGDDTLWGRSDDVLVGGTGADLFRAEAGGTQIEDFGSDDRLCLAMSHGAWHVRAGEAGETVLTRTDDDAAAASDTSGDVPFGGDVLEAEPARDVVLLAGRYDALLIDVDAEIGTTITVWDGESDGNLLLSAGEAAAATGGVGDDSLFGSDSADALIGGLGADLIEGGAGADVIYGDGYDGGVG